MESLKKNNFKPVKRPILANIYKNTKNIKVAFLLIAKIKIKLYIKRIKDGLVILAKVIIKIIFIIDYIYNSDSI